MRKIPTRLRGANFCTSSARFAPSFVSQPNGPECTQMVRNIPKLQFRVKWGGSVAFVAKNSDTTPWHELLHWISPFSTEFCKATNSPECTQMVRNAPIRQFRVQWGGSGAFIAKNSDTTLLDELFHYLHRVSCSNEMVPNAPKHFETQQNMAWIGWICCKNY